MVPQRTHRGQTRDVADLVLHPDRFLPADLGVRQIARDILAATSSAPIVSPHGHVDPELFVTNAPFRDPTRLLISPDHYVTRLLYARGASLTELGVGNAPLDEKGSRQAFTVLCEAWESLAGTAVRGWFTTQFVELFGVTEMPSANSAMRIYDQIAECLSSKTLLPRALFDRFGIEVLATTDDPCSDLAAHHDLAHDPTWNGRVIPTFRPDAYLEPARIDWVTRINELGIVADIDTSTYEGYISALEARRSYFRDHGATATDHSHDDAGTQPLDEADAARIFDAARNGKATPIECVAFRRHMLCEMARMSCEDGLVMMLHCGVFRNHHRPSFDRFGPDTGHDLPRPMTFTKALQPLLQRFGTHPNFRLVCFTLDEVAWGRDLAPLSGFYPSVIVGVPWWFLDAPDAMKRFWNTIVDQIGFTRTSGFIDDTRALCSIPARHDLSRRIEAGVLARLVAEHRMGFDEAARIATRLVKDQPCEVFSL